MVEHREPRLHQPKRWLVVGAEVVLAVVFVLIAIWAWQRGIVPMEYPRQNGAPFQLERHQGQWWLLAVGLCTAAGLLALDAVRQALLAKRGKFKPVELTD
ncbi:hypothetical protein GCM10022247_22580 [Allokutzneria multivorans]|uniref:ABC transporter permease n=1 Tax=Allokutzneria multivorans TaxID=1142134 RepID=A0ABP7RSG5_9PSEU